MWHEVSRTKTYFILFSEDLKNSFNETQMWERLIALLPVQIGSDYHIGKYDIIQDDVLRRVLKIKKK